MLWGETISLEAAQAVETCLHSLPSLLSGTHPHTRRGINEPMEPLQLEEASSEEQESAIARGQLY